MLAGIVIAGTLLRIRRIRKKGVFLYDEAAYYREATVVRRLFGFVRKNWKTLLSSRNDPASVQRKTLVEEYCDVSKTTLYSYYKAWHVYIIKLSLRLIKQKDVAIAAPSIAMGVFTIVLVYLNGSIAFGKAVGVMAAAMLAVSGLHTLHSRSAGPESGMAMCYQLLILFSLSHKIALAAGGASYFYSPESFLLLAASGVFLGGIVMFHPFWIGVIPGVVFISEAAYAIFSASMPFMFFAISISVVFAAAAACILISDIPFIICAYLFPEGKVISHSAKSMEWVMFNINRLKDMLKKSEGEGVKVSWAQRIGFYPKLFLNSDGIALAAAAGCGIALLAARREPLDVYLAAQAIVFIGFLTVIPWKAARGIVIFAPALILAAAFAVSELPVLAAAPVLLWIIVRNSIYSYRVGNLTSGIRLAVEYIRSQGEQSFICTSFPFVSLYGKENDMPVDPAFDMLVLAAAKKFRRYLIIDHHEHFPQTVSDSGLQLIQEKFEPVFKAEDPCVTFFPVFMEAEFLWHGIHFSKSVNLAPWNQFRQNPSEKDRSIRVYDLYYLLENKLFIEIIMLKDFMEKGFAFYKEEDYPRALTCYKKAARLNPGEPLPKFYVGVCQAKLGHPKWASQVFKELILEKKLPVELLSVCEDYLEKNRLEQLSGHPALEE